MRTLFELSPYSIYMLDKDGCVQAWNPKSEQTFGWSEREVLGRLPPLVPACNVPKFVENHAMVWAGTPRLDDLLPTVSKSGQIRQMLVSKLPIRDDSGQVVSSMTIMRDETERQRVWMQLVEDRTRMEQRVRQRTSEIEASNLALRQEIAKRTGIEQSMRHYQLQLRSLASELRTTEERQRRRIASDLHDGIGQSLALAQAKLAELTSCPKNTAHRRGLTEVLEFIQHAVTMSRSLAYDLSPPILYDLGLEPALDWLAEKFGVEYKLLVHLARSGSSAPLNADVRATLFRSVWELLMNIYRHARTEQAWVNVRRTATDLEISVEDRGIGFVPAQASGGLGVFSIRERMESMGGSMDITSEPGKGTSVVLRVPVQD